ncbi:MAG: HPr family phosphocarrier protein [Bacillota bacterium]|nr:HPr family phosphocarrier protein [Bacillota bacterium]
MISKNAVVLNKQGMHARPASMFVGAAGKFKSKITIEKGEKQGNAKSIFSLLALGIIQGSEVRIFAEGEDEAEAVDTLIGLIESRFGEE